MVTPRHMTEETIKRINEILKSVTRWLDSQSDYYEYQRLKREWDAENDTLSVVELEFDWEFSDDWS